MYISIFADLVEDKKLLSEDQVIHILSEKRVPRIFSLKLPCKSSMDEFWPYYIVVLIKLSILKIMLVTSFYVSHLNVLLEWVYKAS